MCVCVCVCSSLNNRYYSPLYLIRQNRCHRQLPKFFLVFFFQIYLLQCLIVIQSSAFAQCWSKYCLK